MITERTTALVTGASRGIGREIAARLREAGARVIAVARDPVRLEAVASEIGATAVAADIADAAAVAELVERTREEFGGAPEILVNAAGAFELAPLAEMEPGSFDAMLGVNLRGPFLLIRAFLPEMLERGSGHIVSLGSIAGRMAFPHNGGYSASKFGVRGLHAVLDAEVRGTGVRATLVEPAATDTPIWESIDRERNPGLPTREAMLSPGAVADAVLFAITRPPEVDVRNLILERA